MIGIVLAGGFAKRMRPLTYSKPLLPVGGKPCIGHVCDKLSKIKNLDRIHITTSRLFGEDYRNWLESSGLDDRFTLSIEPAQSEGEKFGALRAILYLINKEKINDDILICAGDNYFDFSFDELLEAFTKSNSITVGLYDLQDKEKVKLYSEIILKGEHIQEFKEKPMNPKSSLVSMAIYIYPKEVIELLRKAVSNGHFDNLGKFIEFVVGMGIPVIGKVMIGKWIDIGDKNSYLEANSLILKGKSYISNNCDIDESSEIGDNVVIGEGCKITKSQINKSIILPNSIIRSSTVLSSVVGANSRLLNQTLKEKTFEAH